MTTALIFDIGVYLAVIGMVLVAVNLMGQSTPPVKDNEAIPPDPVESPDPATANDHSREVKA